jgi:tetratricopeptide (TPR) repeat protein
LNDIEVCLRWIRQADDLRGREPRRALELAHSARDLAARLDLTDLGQAFWRALQADAWAVLGSCWRANGDLRRAESCLTVAWSFLADGPLHDPLSPARLSQRAAYVRGDQGRLDEALRLIDSAVATYQRLNERGWTACALIDKAVLLHRAGRTREALPLLDAAQGDLDPERDSAYYLAAVHNRAVFLEALAERPEDLGEALRSLEIALRAHARAPDSLSLLKGCALTALAAIKLGRRQEAAEELWRCWEGFHRLGAAADELWALLHLLTLALVDANEDQILRIAGLLFPLQQSLDLETPARTALRDLIQKAQRRELTADLTQQLIRTLQGR